MRAVLLLLLLVACVLVAHAYRPRFVSKLKTKDGLHEKRMLVDKNKQFMALMRNLPQQYYLKQDKRFSIDDDFDEEKRGRNVHRQNSMLAWMRNVPLKRFGSAGLFDPNRFQSAFYDYELPTIGEN